MCFGVLHGNTQVEDVRVQYEALIRYFETLYLVMFLRVYYMFFVSSQCRTEVHIFTAVAA